MGLFGKKAENPDGLIMNFNAAHISGLPVHSVMCTMSLYPDKLVIEALKNKFEIPSERLKRAKIETEQKVIEKNKSVLGRAAVGGLLLGPAGAVVGGMSGTGKKQKKGLPDNFLKITYQNNEGVESELVFMNNFNIIKIYDFVLKINEIVVGKQSPNNEPIVL